MKIFLKLPNGLEFHLERQPMEDGKFYALCCVAAGALVVLLFVATVALRR